MKNKFGFSLNVTIGGILKFTQAGVVLYNCIQASEYGLDPSFCAPNFKEVEVAYWFGPVHGALRFNSDRILKFDIQN